MWAGGSLAQGFSVTAVAVACWGAGRARQGGGCRMVFQGSLPLCGEGTQSSYLLLTSQARMAIRTP